jgi:predicted Zn finger-like uncharacterized protein
MALATRCPHCHTTFRVAHDQLKLRAGLVRCGACKEIFNGIEHLLPQDGLNAAPAAAPSPAQPAVPARPAAPPVSAPTEPVPGGHLPLPEAPGSETMESMPSPMPAAEDEAEAGAQGEETHEETASSTPMSDAEPQASVAQAEPPEAAQAAHAAQQTAKAPAQAPDADLDIPDFSEFLVMAEAAAKDEPAPPAEEPSAPPSAHEQHHMEEVRPELPQDLDPGDPLTRMTLMDVHDGEDLPQSLAQTPAATGDGVDPLEQTIDELQSRPERRKTSPRRLRNMQRADDEEHDPIDAFENSEDVSIAEDIDEPSFVRKARFQERFGPLINWSLGIGSLLLALLLAAQGVYSFRNQLAARLPKAKPALVKACAWLNCRVTLPMQIDSISIEANELQSTGTGKDTFVFNVVLRNRSAVTQAWPNLELTLKDTNGKPLVRRDFLPRDYLLDVQDVERGFAPSTEQQIKLVFSVTQPDSSGYEVAIFYP